MTMQGVNSGPYGFSCDHIWGLQYWIGQRQMFFLKWQWNSWQEWVNLVCTLFEWMSCNLFESYCDRHFHPGEQNSYRNHTESFLKLYAIFEMHKPPHHLRFSYSLIKVKVDTVYHLSSPGKLMPLQIVQMFLSLKFGSHISFRVPARSLRNTN